MRALMLSRIKELGLCTLHRARFKCGPDSKNVLLIGVAVELDDAHLRVDVLLQINGTLKENSQLS